MPQKEVVKRTFVEIEGEGFHIDDEIEVTDVEGNPVRYNGGGSSIGTGFGVHEDTAEGVITIRIGNKKFGKGQYTEPFTFIVTHDPLPVELSTWFMKSVAPGQWLGLQVSNKGPLKHSELTEVVFRQAGREVIVAAPKPFRPRVAVPGVLSAGEVELQVRTWRDGRVSLVRPGEVITLTATELDEKADWFSDVQVRLPMSLEPGEWRMIVSSETDGTHDEVPFVIRVVKK